MRLNMFVGFNSSWGKNCLLVMSLSRPKSSWTELNECWRCEPWGVHFYSYILPAFLWEMPYHLNNLHKLTKFIIVPSKINNSSVVNFGLDGTIMNFVSLWGLFMYIAFPLFYCFDLLIWICFKSWFGNFKFPWWLKAILTDYCGG